MNAPAEAPVKLAEVSERFLCCPPARRQDLLPELLKNLREAISAGRFDEAATAVRRVTTPMLDYTTAQSLYRIRKLLRGKITLPSPPVKLAILGSFTTKQLVAFVDLYLFA